MKRISLLLPSARPSMEKVLEVDVQDHIADEIFEKGAQLCRTGLAIDCTKNLTNPRRIFIGADLISSSVITIENLEEVDHG